MIMVSDDAWLMRVTYCEVVILVEGNGERRDTGFNFD